MPTQELSTLLNAYGVSSTSSNFSFANIMAWIIFGIIGMCAFNYGRKERSFKPLMIGVVLMVYPYFVSNTILLYALGIGISSLLYFWRD